MSKRFFNTELHNDPWYMELKPKHKSLWHHILMTCNHSGLWQVNFKAASLFVNDKITKEECMEIFKNNIIQVDDGRLWFIPSFIYDQYGKILNPKSSVHKGVIENLKTYNLINKETFLIEFTKSDLTLKDKAKEKVKANVLNSSSKSSKFYVPGSKLKTKTTKKKTNASPSARQHEKNANTSARQHEKNANSSARQHENTAGTPAPPNAGTHHLQLWVSENAPEVDKLKKPLTTAECIRLCDEFGEEKVKAKLLEMENYNGLAVKYTSANLTLRNWLRLEMERKAERQPQTTRKYTPPADNRTTFRYLQPGELNRKKADQELRNQGGKNAGLL